MRPVQITPTLVTSIAIGMLFGCGQDQPLVEPASNCVVIARENWAQNGLSGTVSQPAAYSCPVPLSDQQGPWPQTLAAEMTAPNGKIDPTSVVVVEVTFYTTVERQDGSGGWTVDFEPTGDYMEGSWFLTGDGHWVAPVHGVYLAGIGRRVQHHVYHGVQQHDVGRAWTLLSNAAQARAEVFLPYDYDVGAAITGPGSIAPGTSVTLAASHTNGKSPVTYRWYRGTTYIGSGTNLITTPPSISGTYQYTVRAVDVEGDTGRAVHPVYVGTGGGGGSGGGGGGSGGNCLRIVPDSSTKVAGDSIVLLAPRMSHQDEIPCP